MNPKDLNPEAILDQAIESIRAQRMDAHIEDEACSRVGQALVGGQSADSTRNELSTCAHYQALIPSYLQGALADGRKLLFEDHTRHCIPCRKALKTARVGASESPIKSSPATIFNGPWPKWIGLAAMIAVIIGLAQVGIFDFTPATGQATVHSVAGTLFSVSDGANHRLTEGEFIDLKEGIRTARDTGAVIKLPDGSLVEVRERSEFYLSQARDGLTLNLDRGSVIVKAAEQSGGHLYVRTNDCTIAVQGTIFSVNSGAKGSRVSVLEGEVRVEQGRQETVLTPGMQFTSSPRLAPVPLEREIAWSQDFDEHKVLLEELTAINDQVRDSLFPGVRYSSRFLDGVPSDTMIYVAVPNLGSSLGHVQDLFMNRVNQNPALKDYWEHSLNNQSGGMTPLEAIERLRRLSDHLGDEIVVAFSPNSSGEPETPLLLAEVNDASGFRSVLEAEAATINAQAGQQALVIVYDPASSGDLAGELFVFPNGDVVAASPDLEVLRRYQAQGAGASGFDATSFYAKLNDAYFEGVDWLFGVDLQNLIDGGISDGDRSLLQQSGLMDIRHFLVELRENEGNIENRAMLTFDESRRGITSWLAAPAPIGGLEFVSGDATVAAAFAVKEPEILFQELVAMVRSQSDDSQDEIGRVKEELGIDPQTDLAAVLGGEFVFAVDGPILPSPAWKVIIEVYDAAHLQETIETIVSHANSKLEEGGLGSLSLEERVVSGRTFYALRSSNYSYTVYYTFVDGYLIAGPNPVLTIQALQYRDAGFTLTQSSAFTALLPSDQHTGFSAVLYQDLGSVLGPLVKLGRSANLSTKQKAYLDSFAEKARASLICAYGEEDRILIASTGHFDLLDPGSLIGLGGGLPGLGGLSELLGVNR